MESIQTFLKKFNQDIQELLRKLLNDLQIISEELAEYINLSSWNHPAFYDDDDDDKYTFQYTEYLENSSNIIIPDLPTEKPDNSLIMGDEHLGTIPETKSDEVIKSSVEDLVSIPSESEGISYDTDDDSFEDIDYVEASPLDSELIGLEELKDEILHEKLLNIHLFIAKIESLNDKPTPDRVLNDHTKETNSGSTTTHADNSFPKYDLFLFEIELDQGKLNSVVMDDILGEPHVHVPNVLPTHPNLMMDSDFVSSNDSLGSDLEVSFPFGTRNKIFDLGIFFEVQCKNLLSPDEFSISFIRDPPFPVIDTLL
nr:hypothetical protein [Tanacetum cinerariifolium]